MSGFVYIWRDRKHNRFYIGSHWGSENDSYICSSTWMRNSRKRRPQDFKRRILARVASSRLDLLMEEQRWIYMIQDDEFGKKYYNLAKGVRVPWHTYDEDRRTVGQKISAAHADPEIKEKHRARVKAGLAAMSEEAKAEKARRFRETRSTPESFARASASQKAAVKDYKNGRGGLFKKGHATWNAGTAGQGVMRAWNKGTTGVSSETSNRMSKSAKKRGGKHVSQKGRIWVNDGVRNVKLPAGVTDVPVGFVRGMLPKPSRWEKRIS
jgi:hypothetical protein